MEKRFYVFFLFFLLCVSNSFAMQYDIIEDEFREFFSTEFAKYIKQFIPDKSVEEIKEVAKVKFVPFKADFQEAENGEFWLMDEPLSQLLNMLRKFLQKDIFKENFRVGIKIDGRKKLFIFGDILVNDEVKNNGNKETADLGLFQTICPCVIF